MCIAIYKPSGQSIDRETLKRCFDKNPDGCGFSYIDSVGELCISVSMDFNTFYGMYEECLEECPDSPYLIHFRIATQGSVDEDNCHPFFIEEDDGHCNKVFMHNGSITPMTKYCERNVGPSDTAMFGMRILEQLPEGWEDNAAIRDLIEEYIGWSKIVVMNDSGEVTIYNEKKGEWADGLWYSNSGYKKPEPVPYKPLTKYAPQNKYWGNRETYTECEYCNTYLPDVVEAMSDGFVYRVCKDCYKDFVDVGIVFTSVHPIKGV